MAATTPISEIAGGEIVAIWGMAVPAHCIAFQTRAEDAFYVPSILWRRKLSHAGDTRQPTHRMPIPETYEEAVAVIAAMKLT